MKNLLQRPDLHAARVAFERACALSRQYDESLTLALHAYGSHGPQISGAGRDHFPDWVKDQLRAVARMIGEASDEAYRAKPARVRQSTIRALARAVAARDDSGFYGPQA